MEAIVKKQNAEELSAVYLEAHEQIQTIEEINNTLDNMDPMLDRLNDLLDVNAIKRNRVRNKISKIMAKL